MAMGKPTPQMLARHLQAGKGTADACRGVYKGKKANATGEGVESRKKLEVLEKSQAKPSGQKRQSTESSCQRRVESKPGSGTAHIKATAGAKAADKPHNNDCDSAQPTASDAGNPSKKRKNRKRGSKGGKRKKKGVASAVA